MFYFCSAVHTIGLEIQNIIQATTKLSTINPLHTLGMQLGKNFMKSIDAMEFSNLVAFSYLGSLSSHLIM